MTTWHELLASELEQDYYRDMMARIDAERKAGGEVYPPSAEVFRALDTTPPNEVKVVIVGRDPYHGLNQAHGLAFSVRDGTPIPPALESIYRELSRDIVGFRVPDHGCLSEWAKQGCLLLNDVLTVGANRPGSHAGYGWIKFTDRIISILNERYDGLVFMLWGGHAQKKGRRIDRNRHLVLTAPHPSPLTAYRGFFGCRHFSLANEYLSAQGKMPIDWRITLLEDLP